MRFWLLPGSSVRAWPWLFSQPVWLVLFWLLLYGRWFCRSLFSLRWLWFCWWPFSWLSPSWPPLFGRLFSRRLFDVLLPFFPLFLPELRLLCPCPLLWLRLFLSAPWFLSLFFCL